MAGFSGDSAILAEYGSVDFVENNLYDLYDSLADGNFTILLLL